MKFNNVLFFCCKLLLICPWVGAQSVYSAGGTAVDRTDAAVPGIHIIAIDPSGKELAKTTSGADGHFILRRLPPGRYTLISAASGGFGAVQLSFVIRADSLDLKLIIPLAAVDQTVTVAPEQEMSIDSAENKDAVNFDSDTLESLPVFDQDYLAMMMPLPRPGCSRHRWSCHHHRWGPRKFAQRHCLCHQRTPHQQ